MSNKTRAAQYADPNGVVVEGFARTGILCEGPANPANGRPGYETGALFVRRGGTAGNRLFVNTGTAASSQWTAIDAALGGTAAGIRLARGVSTVTGTLTVATGLTTVVAVVACLQDDAALVGGTMVTATVGNQTGTPPAGSVILNVWRPTSATDTTPIASATARSVNWIAVGV